jgi:hypothetical protein
LENHKDWFLKYHPNAIDIFENEVNKKYRDKRIKEQDLFETLA